MVKLRPKNAGKPIFLPHQSGSLFGSDDYWISFFFIMYVTCAHCREFGRDRIRNENNS